MARWHNGSRRLARRLLPLTMAGVVVVFVASTVYTELLLTDDADTLDIASNSAPSIAELANARAELRGLQVAADRGVPDDYDLHRRRLDEALAEYARTPDYRGEHELYQAVRVKLASFDEAVRAGAGAPPAERAAAVARIDAAIDALDSALHELSELNRQHLRSAAGMLAHHGRWRNRWAFLLDGFGIVVAIVATVLAMRTVDRYLATTARRARELEHLAIEVTHEIATPLTPIELALGGNGEGAGEPNHPGMARARRAVQRIRSSLERLSTFAAAARPPATLPRTPFRPAIDRALHDAGLPDVAADPEWHVRCAEASLQALLHDLFGACADSGAGPIESVAIDASSERVRVSVVRAPSKDRQSDPFDPQLHVPGTEHPGIDLRLATVRRRVEACGGRVGVRRERRSERLWIELPRAWAAP